MLTTSPSKAKSEAISKSFSLFITKGYLPEKFGTVKIWFIKRYRRPTQKVRLCKLIATFIEVYGKFCRRRRESEKRKRYQLCRPPAVIATDIYRRVVERGVAGNLSKLLCCEVIGALSRGAVCCKQSAYGVEFEVIVPLARRIFHEKLHAAILPNSSVILHLDSLCVALLDRKEQGKGALRVCQVCHNCRSIRVVRSPIVVANGKCSPLLRQLLAQRVRSKVFYISNIRYIHTTRQFPTFRGSSGRHLPARSDDSRKSLDTMRVVTGVHS